jgi:23S rRNA G2069 N7-methylase RlmK/C1962 C5-methylase RlmI
MDREMDKGKKKEAMDLIMMEEDQIKNIIEKYGKTLIIIPYQYKMNNKKRAITEREVLVRNEEEVEDLWDVEKIEEILTYERKNRNLGSGTKGINPI